MKYVFNFKQLSICTWRLINTCACVKFLQVLQIVHRYLWTTLTYLQNICKLVTDILQIRENLLQIIAVLSQICYRYWQIFNIYVSLVREYRPTKSVHFNSSPMLLSTKRRFTQVSLKIAPVHHWTHHTFDTKNYVNPLPMALLGCRQKQQSFQSNSEPDSEEIIRQFLPRSCSRSQMVKPFSLPCYWSILLFYGRNTNLVPSQIPECTCSSAFTFCSHWTSQHLLTLTPAFRATSFSTSYVTWPMSKADFRGSRKGGEGVGGPNSISLQIVFFKFSTCTNPIIHLFYPPRICMCIVLDFSWDISMSQEKLQTMIMQNFGG